MDYVYKGKKIVDGYEWSVYEPIKIEKPKQKPKQKPKKIEWPYEYGGKKIVDGYEWSVWDPKK